MLAPVPSKALIMGSIKAKDNKQAFTVAAHTLGTKLRCLPDGETGHRSSFLWFQLEKVPKRVHRNFYEYKVEDFTPEKLDPPLSIDEFLPNTYDTEAIASYKVFCDLREQGLIKRGQKFQVCVPSPLNITRASIQTRHCEEAEPLVEQRMVEALQAIQDNIPAEDLSIQWDLPSEIMFLEHPRMNNKYQDAFIPYFKGDQLEGLVSRLARVSAHIRPDVDLGMHLCYGDIEHEHVIEPEDAGVLATFINAVAEKFESVHKIAYIHIPVPKERDDAAYFEPLKKLKFDGDLYLGLVREGDEEGSRKRLETARAVLDREFGVSTVCGLGRVPEGGVEGAMGIINTLTSG